ncbi:uncharacterized protein LOC131166508 [Malania oleifera]|uniref:uncharacterized protein LOC131166508 n=1 Tax=Malania oleifera TaxID=397392 RepID=UPI0025AE3C54|nr:uncharacterized protein LOC131166508 [Malania oleifera]
MASSLDISSSSSLLSPPSASFVTQEEFNLFHSIDRELYTRLVLALGRDPGETMQVMALWLWLEDAGGDQLLVKKLLSLPDTLLYSLADEALVCLRCVETDSFPAAATAAELPLTQSLLATDTTTTLSTRFFHENRLAVLRGVTRIFNDVCARAFDDIRRLVPVLSGTTNIHPPPQFLRPAPFYDPYDLGAQRQLVSNELSELLNRINLVTPTDHQDANEKMEVPADDRTIFLTFSKGYPISEIEVRDFFTKKFGECIEAIFMQEVTGEEQVLYARLVVRSAAVIEVVLDGQSKAKFSINGKHVWARKYIRKRSKSPRGPNSPPKATAHTASSPAEEAGRKNKMN